MESEKHIAILKRLSMSTQHFKDELPDDMIASTEMVELCHLGLVEVSPYGAKTYAYRLTDLGYRIVLKHLSMAEKVVHGLATLFTAEKLCSRLGVSRPTLDRWLNNKDPIKVSFPPPDVYIGESPRWEITTVTKWLVDNSSLREVRKAQTLCEDV